MRYLFDNLIFSFKDENSLFQNKIFNIPVEDSSDADVYSHLQNVVKFIGEKKLRMNSTYWPDLHYRQEKIIRLGINTVNMNRLLRRICLIPKDGIKRTRRK